MAHTHVVVDSDAHFIIDPITRAIKKEESAKVSLIVGDHNSERFSFELPRYIEGHDMSLCNVVRVHYMNTSASKTEQQSIGIYEVDDFGILSTDDTKMGLSWLISNNATKYVGKLAFTVQFACMTGYRVDYSWQSGVYSSMSISDGINGSEIVFDEYADILQQWWLKLYASSELPIKIYTTEEFAALDGKTESEVLYLLEDDPTFTTIEEHGNTIVNHATRIDDHETRITDNKALIDNHETRITDNKALIDDHETRITDNKALIDDHAARITDNKALIDDHAARISSNEVQLGIKESQLSDHETRINDHETRITDNKALIDDHETRITDNKTNINNLENKTKAFYTDNAYTVIVNTEDGVNNAIRDGLWLFKVNCGTDILGADGSVSVIMDTNCQYSTMFYVSVPNGDATDRYLAAIKRTSRNIMYHKVSLRLVLFKPYVVTLDGYAIPTATFVEEYASNDVIWGKPFGFSNFSV